jgi:hypothetical protein
MLYYEKLQRHLKDHRDKSGSAVKPFIESLLSGLQKRMSYIFSDVCDCYISRPEWPSVYVQSSEQTSLLCFGRSRNSLRAACA